MAKRDQVEALVVSEGESLIVPGSICRYVVRPVPTASDAWLARLEEEWTLSNTSRERSLKVVGSVIEYLCHCDDFAITGAADLKVWCERNNLKMRYLANAAARGRNRRDQLLKRMRMRRRRAEEVTEAEPDSPP